MYLKIGYKNSIHLMSMKSVMSYQQLEEYIKSVFLILPKKLMLAYKDKNQNINYICNDQDIKKLFQFNLKTIKVQIVDGEQKDSLQQQKKYGYKSQNYRLSNHEKPGENQVNEKGQEEHSNGKTQINRQRDVINQKQKIEERKLETNQYAPKVIHKNTVCSECQTKPIIGIRYKCVFCQNFDLCEQCEAKSTHEHPFLKIRCLNHNPLKIFSIIGNQEQFFQVNDNRNHHCEAPKKVEENKSINKFFGRIKQYTLKRF